jgi:DNA repair protein RadD
MPRIKRGPGGGLAGNAFGNSSNAAPYSRDRHEPQAEPLELRAYQTDLVERLRASYRNGHRAPLLQLATGGGKTIVFCEVARGAHARGNRVLVVAHRRELIAQAGAKLTWAGVSHGIIAAGFPPAPDAMVQVGSVQTLARRLHLLPPFNLLILDECHHARAAQWARLIDSQPGAKLLGVTATPARLDGKGLGAHCGGCFDDLISGPSIAELVDGEYLSPARYFVPDLRVDLSGLRVQAGDWVAADLAARVDQKAITGDAVAKYRELADHRPAIAFCALVSHAEHVAEQFREAGYRAASVDGKMAKPDRDRLIAGLGTGEIEVLPSCDLISEGLDVPALGGVILLRPTKSLVLHMQQIGRGMRPAPGKDALIVLDHVGNIRRHGRPDFERIWTLDGVEKPHGEAPLRICPECQAANPIGAEECEVCGFEFPRGEGRRRAPGQQPGDLAEMTAERLTALQAMSYRQIVRTRLSETELRAYAQARGYKPGWVFHRLRDQRTRVSA